MGKCCGKSLNQTYEEIQYQETLAINIKTKNSSNKTIQLDSVRFIVTKPMNQQNNDYTLEKLKLHVSACVLPGLDPRLLTVKECQDGYICLQHEDALLIALFDGHGKEGLQVMELCKSFMSEFFVLNYSEFLKNPKMTIESMIIECDEKLRSISNEINSSLSGTTATIALIANDGAYISSVGDSRAIIATIPHDNNAPGELPIRKNPYSRKIKPSRELRAIPLTIDQTLDYQPECERIKKCGGNVHQFIDDYGNKTGPFRAWLKNEILPGIDLSRSIGDGIGKQIGVIAEPICHYFKHSVFRDQFYVIASKGVWEVMENIEVVNFVERFRKKCLKKHGPKAYPHKVFYK